MIRELSITRAMYWYVLRQTVGLKIKKDLGMYFVVFIATVALLVAVLLTPDVTITGKEVSLGSARYDVVSVQTPVVTGSLLDIFAFVATQTRLGPWLRRKLLNENHVEVIRQLAAQIDFPPMYFPMRRTDKARLFATDAESSAQQLHTVLQQGVDGSEHSGAAVGRSVEEYAAHYRSGATLPSEVLTRTLRTLHAWEKEGFKIFSSVHDELVMSQARASDERFKAGKPLSILDGVPIAFKDMISAAQHVSYSGHSPLAQFAHHWHNATEDDTILQRFRALGAIVLGLTVQVEGGVTPVGYNAHWQGPFSPYSWYRYSGGSSSGSGVAVGTGLVPIAIGFDGGGSVRAPASLSGAHGLAVTFGRIPFDSHLDSVLIKAGPIASSAADVTIAYAALSPNKAGSFYNVLYDGDVHGPPLPSLTHSVAAANAPALRDLSDVRIGVYSEWFDDSDPAVRERCRAALRYLEERGATIVEIAIPHLQAMSIAHGLKISSEFAQTWDKIWGEAPQSLEPNTLITLGIGASTSSVEILAGDKLRAYLFEYVTELFQRERLTAIATPTIAVEAPPLTKEARTRGESNTALSVAVMRFLSWVNFLGLPGYSVPVGYVRPSKLLAEEDSQTQVPVGFQLVGDHWSEDELLRLARSIEFGFTATQEKVKPMYFFDALQQE